MTSERALKTAIVRSLKEQGILAWRNPVGPFSNAGLPDILAVLPRGRLLAIEAKAPGRYKNVMSGLTPTQHAWCDALRKAEALVIVTDSLSDFRICLAEALQANREDTQ